MPVIFIGQSIDHRIECVVYLATGKKVKGFHVQLIADALLVGACRGDQEEQRLFTGITGTFGQNIVELAVGLGMDLIQHKPGHVQAMLRTDFRRQYLIESGIAVVHDTLSCRHDLAAFHESRGHLHHLVGNVKDDGCLLAVGGCAIDFCGGLVIGKQQIQCHRSGQLRLAVFLADLHIRRAELAVATLVHDAKHIPDDLFLPRQ